MALISDNVHMSLPLIPCIFQWPKLMPLMGKPKCKALPTTLHWICDAFTPAAHFVFRWIKGLSFSMLTLLLPLCLCLDDIIGSLTHVLLIVPSCQFLITNGEESVWEQALVTQLHTLSNIINKRYEVLQGTACVWKMQNIQHEFVLHAFNQVRNELS